MKNWPADLGFHCTRPSLPCYHRPDMTVKRLKRVYRYIANYPSDMDLKKDKSPHLHTNNFQVKL